VREGVMAMTDEIPLPSRLVCLGEAMAPVLGKLDAALSEKSQPTVPVGSIVDVIKEGLAALGGAMPRLSVQVNGLMTDVAANESASDQEVFRAVGRFDGVLDEIISDYRKVCRQSAYGSDEEACELLAGTYRHSMREIQIWLQDLVHTLADPIAALHRKGLPTTGSIEIPLTLTLTSAPELTGLQRWGERHSLYTPSPTPTSQGLGFWGTVGAIAFGWGIGEALFGDDD
jgi:hypothetical protein